MIEQVESSEPEFLFDAPMPSRSQTSTASAGDCVRELLPGEERQSAHVIQLPDRFKDFFSRTDGAAPGSTLDEIALEHDDQSRAGMSNRSQINLGTTADNQLHEKMDAVVEVVSAGAFDFFELSTIDGASHELLEKIFRHQLSVEFGQDRGGLLYERYRQKRVSPHIRRAIESVEEFSIGLFRKFHLVNHESLMLTLGGLMAEAHHIGGLDTVDNVVEELNERLRSVGSRFGLGPGSACMDDDQGRPAWLAVIFSDLETGELLSLQWCSLGAATPA